MKFSNSQRVPTFSRRLLLVATLVATGVAGCLSPAIPLPPPGAPQVSSPNAEGFVLVQGRVPETTTAFAQNLRTGQIVGQVTDETGEYSLSLQALPLDNLSVYYQDGLETSPSVRVSVPETDIDSSSMAGSTSR